MVSEKQLKFICTKCGNCCTDKNTLVNLTYLDILKIKNGLSLDLKELLEVIGFYLPNKEILRNNHEKMVISPIETEKGLAYIGLLKNSSGACFFFDEEKKTCSIYNLRPIFCRTFPFSFRLQNENNVKIFYTEKAKQYCPGINSEAPELDLNYWINLGNKVIEDLNKNHIFIKKWNSNVKKKGVSSSVNNFLKIIFDLSRE